MFLFYLQISGFNELCQDVQSPLRSVEFSGVGVEIWTVITWYHIHSLSSLLLPLTFNKKDFLVNRYNLSHLQGVPDGQIHFLPTPCCPKREEDWSCLPCGLLREWPLPTAQPPAQALFSLSSPAQHSPTLGIQAASISISFDPYDHLPVSVPLTRLCTQPECPPPAPRDQKSLCQRCPQVQPELPGGQNLSVSSEAMGVPALSPPPGQHCPFLSWHMDTPQGGPNKQRPSVDEKLDPSR